MKAAKKKTKQSTESKPETSGKDFINSVDENQITVLDMDEQCF